MKDGKQIGVRDAEGKDFYFDKKDNLNPPKDIKIVDPKKEAEKK